jgi:hypothetical protein
MIERALAVKQPMASLIADGSKSIEVRTWSTPYRGRILITASLGASGHFMRQYPERRKVPRGVAICSVELVDVRKLRKADSDKACYKITATAGRYAWILREPKAVNPTPIKSKLGLWRL